MKIHIVFGESGKYEDHSEWMVEAYVDEEKAKARIDELDKLMVELGLYPVGLYPNSVGNYSNQHVLALKMKAHERGDKMMDFCLGGVSYKIKPIDVVDISDYLKVSVVL